MEGWHVDPWGVHEFRFFSSDGVPTVLVSDGGKTSYDDAPASAPHATAEQSLKFEPESPMAAEHAAYRRPEPPPVPEETLTPGPEPSGSPAPPGAFGTTTRGAAQVAVMTQATVNQTEAGTKQWTATRRLGRETAPPPSDSADVASVPHGDDRSPEPFGRRLRTAYTVVFVVLALSALGLLYVHVRPKGSSKPAHAASSTTTSTAPQTTTTVALPTALKPDAKTAATALVSSWAAGNKASALTVATPAAVTALFAAPYASGLAIDRGCSTTFQPIVCTFGPPGGASPSDPIYQILVTQAAGGWYVSAVKLEN